MSLQDTLAFLLNPKTQQKAADVMTQVTQAGQVYKKVKEQKPLTEPEKKTAQEIARVQNILKTQTTPQTTLSAEKPKSGVDILKNVLAKQYYGITPEKVGATPLAQLGLQEQALEKKGFIKPTLQQKVSDFGITPTYQGGNWADKINLGGLKNTPGMLGGAATLAEIGIKAGASGLQSLLGSTQAAAQGLGKMAESTSSNKTWQERTAGFLGGGLEAGSSALWMLPSAGFAAAAELPVGNQVIKNVVEPSLGAVHGVINSAMDEISYTVPQEYKPFVKDLLQPIANMAADLYILKKGGQAIGAVSSVFKTAAKAKEVMSSPEKMIDYMAETNPSHPLMKQAMTDPVFKKSLGNAVIASIKKSQDIYNTSFKEQKLAFKTGKEGEIPGLTTAGKIPIPENLRPETPSWGDFNKYKEQFPDLKFEGKDDMKLLRDKNSPVKEVVGVANRAGDYKLFNKIEGTNAISPVAQLNAILGLKGEKSTPKSSRVRTKVYDARERLAEIQNPKPMKLPKGKGVIQLGGVGEKFGDVIKIKSGSGEIRINRSEFDTLSKVPELRRSYLNRGFENPIRVFEELGGEFKEMFYRPVPKANHAAQVEIGKTREALKPLEKVANKSHSGASKRIATYLLSKEDMGLELLAARKIKVPELTKAEMDYAGVMKDYYKDLGDRWNKARTAVGKDPVDFRNNYMTRLHEVGLFQKMGFVLDSLKGDQSLPQFIHKVGGNSRFGKERVDVRDLTPHELKKYAKTIELDAFKSLNKYSENIIPTIHMTPVIGKLRSLVSGNITDPATGKTINLQNTETGKYITKWIDRTAGQKSFELPAIIEKPLAALNQNQAFATLSFNLSSALGQPTAILQTVTELGPAWTSVGAKDLMMGRGKIAMEKSNVLLNRTFESAQNDVKGLLGARQAIGEAGLKPLELLDLMTAQTTWLAAYAKAQAGKVKYGKNKQKMTEEQAVNYADDIVTKTQASAAKWDLAPIQNSTLGKTLTMFQTFTINNYNWLKRDVVGFKNKDVTKAQAVKKVMTYALGSALLKAAYNAAGIPSPQPNIIGEVAALASGKQDLGETAGNLSSLVPMVGGIKYLSSEDKQKGPIEQLIASNQTVQLGTEVYKLISGADDRKQSILEMGGRLLGIPGVTQIVKIAKGREANKNGYKVFAKDKNGKLTSKEITIDNVPDQLRAILFGPYSTMKAAETRKELEKTVSGGFQVKPFKTEGFKTKPFTVKKY